MTEPTELDTSHLRTRLRALDPAGNTDTYDKEMLTGLIARTMYRAEASRPDPPRRRPRLLATAAAAVCVVAAVLVVATYLVVGVGPADQRGQVAASPPASVGKLQLPLGAGPAAGICPQFSADQLKGTSVAFSGVVTAVTADRVVLTVDHWYRGGNAQQVELAKRSDVAADNSITWHVGARYLIAATAGTVNVCGSSDTWNAELAADYAKAFAG